MIFADLLFLYIFLPFNLIAYFVTKKTAYKNAVLVFFSFIFYAWGEPVMVILLYIIAEINRLLAVYTEKHANTKKGRVCVTLAVSVTLSSLVFFKYSGLLGLPVTPALPIGISFYSFQVISYAVDVYRGKVKAQTSRMKFYMYVSLYPQLIAGPIVRYADIEASIDNREHTAHEVSYGINRFVIGLAKKVLLANNIGEAAAAILGGNAAALPAGTAWLGIFLFALQIYFDFSGYSDMAIGLGRIFGFTFPENFSYPYISRSVTEFWRRWHMTLGRFFRDYVYIPLGGGRKHYARNVLITWFLTGLWHGASWNFAVWGLYFGVLIIIEKALLKSRISKFTELIPAWVNIPVTFVLVTFGWALFYFTDFNDMSGYIRALAGRNGAGFFDIAARSILFGEIFVIIAACICCLPVYGRIAGRVKKFKYAYYVIPPVNIVLMVLCTVSLVGETVNPFLYFRF